MKMGTFWAGLNWAVVVGVIASSASVAEAGTSGKLKVVKMRAPAQAQDSDAEAKYGPLAPDSYSYKEAIALFWASQNPCVPALGELKKHGLDLSSLYIITDPRLGGWADTVGAPDTVVLSCTDEQKQILAKMVAEKIWNSTSISDGGIAVWDSYRNEGPETPKEIKIVQPVDDCSRRFTIVKGMGVYGQNRDQVVRQLPEILRSYPNKTGELHDAEVLIQKSAAQLEAEKLSFSCHNIEKPDGLVTTKRTAAIFAELGALASDIASKGVRHIYVGQWNGYSKDQVRAPKRDGAEFHVPAESSLDEIRSYVKSAAFAAPTK